MTLKYCGGSPLLAETPFFWVGDARPWRLAWQRDAPGSFVLVHNRPSVNANAGKTSSRRRPQALRRLADAHAQQDPTFRTSLTYTP